jgi:hypothetical protein
MWRSKSLMMWYWQSPEKFAREGRLLLAVKLFEQGRLSSGKAVLDYLRRRHFSAPRRHRLVLVLFDGLHGALSDEPHPAYASRVNLWGGV